ncbi:MAG: pyridoxamine 5'-phosphate oxidase family protein [Dehalococcoidia bacterium]
MNETPETLRWLQAIIDRSAATAGSAIKRNFIGGGWSMSAEEFVTFWRAERMASISTVSASGDVHVAPLDLRLIDGRFYVPTFPDSQRLRDHRSNPRCAIASWDGPYRATIVYGIASEVDSDPTGRTLATATEQAYEPNGVVTIQVTPTRIYAIRPPAGHPTRKPSA